MLLTNPLAAWSLIAWTVNTSLSISKVTVPGVNVIDWAKTYFSKSVPRPYRNRTIWGWIWSLILGENEILSTWILAKTICHNNQIKYPGRRANCFSLCINFAERSSNKRSEESHATSALEITPSPIWKGSINPDKTIQVINNNRKTNALYIIITMS